MNKIIGFQYTSLLNLIKRFFCNHNFKYWKMRMISTRENLNGVEMIRWRECQSCFTDNIYSTNYFQSNLWLSVHGYIWIDVCLYVFKEIKNN